MEKKDFIIGKWYKNIGTRGQYIMKFLEFASYERIRASCDINIENKVYSDIPAEISEYWHKAIECTQEDLKKWLPKDDVDYPKGNELITGYWYLVEKSDDLFKFSHVNNGRVYYSERVYAGIHRKVEDYVSEHTARNLVPAPVGLLFRYRIFEIPGNVTYTDGRYIFNTKYLIDKYQKTYNVMMYVTTGVLAYPGINWRELVVANPDKANHLNRCILHGIYMDPHIDNNTDNTISISSLVKGEIYCLIPKQGSDFTYFIFRSTGTRVYYASRISDRSGTKIFMTDGHIPGTEIRKATDSEIKTLVAAEEVNNFSYINSQTNESKSASASSSQGETRGTTIFRAGNRHSESLLRSVVSPKQTTFSRIKTRLGDPQVGRQELFSE